MRCCAIPARSRSSARRSPRGTWGLGPGGDGVVAGSGRVDGRSVFCYAQDGTYVGGSLGEAHAETIVRVLQLARRSGTPVVGFVGSGGARMQEGIGGARRVRTDLS